MWYPAGVRRGYPTHRVLTQLSHVVLDGPAELYNFRMSYLDEQRKR